MSNSITRNVSHQSDLAKMKSEADGSFKRQDSSFRSFIEKGSQFEPEKDRYHLYVSYACPWATRTLIVRKLKGLEDFIPVTVTSPRLSPNGWPFASVDPFPGAEADPLYNYEHIKDFYLSVAPDYSGRFTVPLLWDKKAKTIVNNESSEIIRMFNTAFNHLLPKEYAEVDLYPDSLKSKIDELNEWIYPNINNGVYRAGFATSQEAHSTAVKQLFEALDKVEGILAGDKKYIVGDQLTECDVRLWVTAVRFDPAYVGHFKCNIRDIRNGYPNINRWMKNLYWNKAAFKDSTNFEHIKNGYYWAQTINPTRIVPVGPIPVIEPL
ncbi:glutathione S-transferase [Gymnopus androsaceus JB14]|uniref:Glutathione S-transferase n=1 Tax=Gymnopus androsaceus JB14 TaxID=1447944 RepID=A0A6A4HC17_9AGAR|nr:glutathione S-transferase [Gymnopus androsaceus JB14]